MKFRKTKYRLIKHATIMPFIWALSIPVIFLDIFAEIYHRICFPIYWMDYIDRNKYIKIDRQKLKYLKKREKLYCMYCWYVNWFLAYAVEIAWRTESYWCWIKHETIDWFKEPKHHEDFLPYNDKQALNQFLK